MKDSNLIKAGASHIAILAIVNFLIISPAWSMMEEDEARAQKGTSLGRSLGESPEKKRRQLKESKNLSNFQTMYLEEEKIIQEKEGEKNTAEVKEKTHEPVVEQEVEDFGKTANELNELDLYENEISPTLERTEIGGLQSPISSQPFFRFGENDDETKTAVLPQKPSEKGVANAQHSRQLKGMRKVRKNNGAAAPKQEIYSPFRNISDEKKENNIHLIGRTSHFDTLPLFNTLTIGSEKETTEENALFDPVWKNLPNELLPIIFKFLDSENRKKCRFLSSAHNSIIMENVVECLKVQWPKASFNSEDLDVFKHILKKFKAKTLSLVGFLPKELIFSWIGKSKSKGQKSTSQVSEDSKKNNSRASSITALDLHESKEIIDDCLYYLKGLSTLKKIDLRGLRISDTGLKKLNSLKLDTLRAGNTNVTGKAFQYLSGSYGSLKILDLSKSLLPNNFGRATIGMPLPTINEDLLYIPQFSILEELDLSGNPINDEGMQCLQGLNHLRILNLSYTKIGDNGLQCMESFTQLTHLYLTKTQVTGKGLQLLGMSEKLSNLRTLDLDQTKVGVSGLSFLEFFNKKKIKEVFLRGTNVRIEDVIRYYQNISGVNAKDLGSYKIITPPNTTDIPALLAEISNIKDYRNIYITKLKMNDNDCRVYYQNKTGIKIILE